MVLVEMSSSYLQTGLIQKANWGRYLSIKQKVRDEMSQGENGCIVTLSIGVCQYPDNGDYDTLVNKADKCLYIARIKVKTDI